MSAVVVIPVRKFVGPVCFDGVMSSDAATFAAEVSPKERLEVLFDELSQLCGQRNAIDGRIVDIVAELERDELCGITGARSMKALVAWKTGITPRNAEILVAVARRLEEFPRCTQDLRDGRLSLDQVGVIAERAADGSDAHYAELAAVATVTQLRTAVKLEPRPEPERRPEPQREITKIPGPDDDYTTWRIRLPRLEAAKFQAALQVASRCAGGRLETRPRPRPRYRGADLSSGTAVPQFGGCVHEPDSGRLGHGHSPPAHTDSTPPSRCI